MQIALICEKCGKIHTEDTDGAVIVFDFKQKQISFICQNKACKKDNIFSFNTWKESIEKSPLPRMKIL